MSERIEISLRALHPRHVDHVAGVLIRGGLIAYPTDSGYALGWRAGNRKAQERVVRIRALDRDHNFTYCCRSLSDVGQLARVDNSAHRLIRRVTPGPFTFILPATSQVPRWAQQRKRHTIGVRIPDHPVPLALLAELGEPLLSSTLILPDHGVALNDAEEIRGHLDHQLDAIIDAGPCGLDVTTVIDISGDQPVLLREGKGDIRPFGFVKTALH